MGGFEEENFLCYSKWLANDIAIDHAEHGDRTETLRQVRHSQWHLQCRNSSHSKSMCAYRLEAMHEGPQSLSNRTVLVSTSPGVVVLVLVLVLPALAASTAAAAVVVVVVV